MSEKNFAKETKSKRREEKTVEKTRRKKSHGLSSCHSSDRGCTGGAGGKACCMTSMETSRLLHQVRAGEHRVAKREQERKPPWESVRVAHNWKTTLDECGDKRGDGQVNCLRDV